MTYLLAALLWLLIFSAPTKGYTSKTASVVKILAVNALAVAGCWQVAVWCVEALG